jgi:pyruvate-formate lyase-activating enzyme
VVDLAELLSLRPLPGSGLLLTLTRRCPLHCAHCSTASTMTAEETDAAALARFVGSFAAADRPEVIMLTGGEPLLHPDLVVELADSAHRAGTRSALLTGGFFARRGNVPARILRAIRAVDHFSVSMDAFHEREVSRADVFHTLRQVLRDGIPASLHVVGSGPDDPYLADLTADVLRTFGGDVPMLVNTIRPLGRAASWATARPWPASERVLPCAMAAWPVVAFDGTVVACCNQDAVDHRPVPEHLRLGHIAEDDWAAVRRRALSSPTLRMIRAVGPTRLLSLGERRDIADEFGYCGGCRRLSDHPQVIDVAGRVASGAVGQLLDEYAARVQAEAGPATFVRRHGSAPYADLVGR